MLAHGLAPHLAIAAYAMGGLLLVVPFLLPRAIARPRHVLGGLVKAAILVAAAFALLDPMRTAIVLLVPALYEPMLLATVPMLFRSVAGLAVTAILVVAFFRQLGLQPVTASRDQRDDPDAGALREMRRARMRA